MIYLKSNVVEVLKKSENILVPIEVDKSVKILQINFTLPTCFNTDRNSKHNCRFKKQK